MHRPQMGLERQPKGDPEGQPKKPQKDCPKGPETAPIDTTVPKRSRNGPREIYPKGTVVGPPVWFTPEPPPHVTFSKEQVLDS